MSALPVPAWQWLRRYVCRVAIFIALTSLAQACLWDWDTLQMERRRFPGVLEVITGKFVRHSPAYYEWRIEDRTRRMRSPAEDPALADDLAVAHAKLGRHAEGLAILQQALAAHPDRYETLANLGTIHMLAGDLQTGKDYVDRAIVINPDAHFGREKYQSLLAEYFLTTRKTPHPASEPGFSAHHRMPFGFSEFLQKKHVISRDENKIADDVAAAQKGVLGMMHFANYDSPVLLEVLGDLLMAVPNHREDAMQLAARAYYRIAQRSDDESVQAQFETAAKNMVVGNVDYINYRGKYDKTEQKYPHDELEKLSADLERELADARTFFAAIEADEKRWIAEGVNVDDAFAEKYYDSLNDTIAAAKQQLSREWRDERNGPFDLLQRRALFVLGALVVGVTGLIFAYRRFRTRPRAAS